MRDALDLQGSVDDLCSLLGRSVAVDNTTIEMIASSAQIGTIDSARSEAILSRSTPEAIATHVRTLGIDRAHGIIDVPANDEMGTLARVCVPLRRGGRLFGYLWVIDVPQLDTRERSVVLSAASQISEILSRTRQHAERRILVNADYLVEAIARDDLSVSDAAAAGVLDSDGDTTVFSLRFASRRTGEPALESDVALTLTDFVRTTSSSRVLAMSDGADILAVGRSRWPSTSNQGVYAAFKRSAQRCDLRVEGAGSASLNDSHIRRAAERAAFARDVGRVRGDILLDSRRLGAWDLLRGELRTEQRAVEICPPVTGLLRYTRAPIWRSLLVYLESGRDPADACAKLSIQRATLYYRLARARELLRSSATGNMPEDIDVQVSLRLWALASLSP